MIQSFILRRNIQQEYLSNFNKYMIDIFYGDSLLIGDEIEAQYRDDDLEGE